MAVVIDSDQHLFEPRDLWTRYIDPAARDDALAIVDDEIGHPWLCWRGRRLGLADVQWPGETDAIGERRERVASPTGLSPAACDTASIARNSSASALAAPPLLASRMPSRLLSD